MDYPLVGTAAEREVGVAETGDERTVYENIKVWQNPAHARICQYLLIGKTSITPDGLVRLGLYTAGKFRKGLNLIHGVSPGKGNIGKFIRLDYFKQLVNRHFTPAIEIPRLGVMTSGTMMGTAGTIYRGPEAGTVSRRLFQYIQYPYHHINTCITSHQKYLTASLSAMFVHRSRTYIIPRTDGLVCFA